jgi:hypothetical protein
MEASVRKGDRLVTDKKKIVHQRREGKESLKEQMCVL